MLGATGILVGVIFLTSVFAQTVLGYSALQTGLAFLPLALVMAVAAHAASHLATKVSARTLAATGLILTVARVAAAGPRIGGEPLRDRPAARAARSSDSASGWSSWPRPRRR